MGEGGSSLNEGMVCKAILGHFSRTRGIKSKCGVCKGDASAMARFEKLYYA